MNKCCPTCGQEFPETRLGVVMTPLKARMFDLVKRSGELCISAATINIMMFDGKASQNTIRSHIYQINDIIENTGWRISGLRGYGYHLKNRKQKTERRTENEQLADAKRR